MNNTNRSYYNFWAKAEENSNSFHLLPYHNLDVAAVGHVLLSLDDQLQERLSCFLHPCAKPLSRSLFTLLLALHDIGKFAESFQNLRPDLLRQLLVKESNARYLLRHDSAGWLLFRHKSVRIKEILFGGSAPIIEGCANVDDTLDVLDPLLRAVFGHHGMPPDRAKAMALSTPLFPLDFESAAAEFVSDVSSLLCIKPIRVCSDTTYSQDCRLTSTGAWIFAGFAVLCDWIGSSSQRFPFQSTRIALSDYWNDCAIPFAEKAIQELGILPCSVRSFGGVEAIFSHIKQPTPLQDLCATVEIPAVPQLFIIEDSTGAGKTEAAISLAHRLLEHGLAQSIFFALPTMATANGVFERVKNVFKNVFTENSRPSLVLSHSRRDLSHSFSQLMFPETATTSVAGDDEPGEVGCAAWFADSRKKSLLASFGVGTIDQALVGVLPIRHQSLRLFGAARSVLIIDEVHAYDTYMTKLLCALLEFQGAFQAPVILLSATLPASLKDKFIAAYRKGLGADLSVKRLPDNPYPSMEIVSRADIVRKTFSTRTSVRRTVDICYVSEESSVQAEIAKAVQAGKSVCWIRNSIEDARLAYQSVSEHLQQSGANAIGKVTLFHSRFCFGDRLEIEESVLEVFGPNGGAKDRSGRILISTQVVEQSLDLDFDVMITDLAPMDLIIQRAGRLMRHSRDASGNRIVGADERGKPLLYVYGPIITDRPGKDWYSAFSRPASFVYPHHGQLFLTAKCLFEKKELRVPEDLRPFIEAVYGDDYSTHLPPELVEVEDRAEGADRGKTSIASINILKIIDGYNCISNEWSPDVDTPTRLTNEQRIVTLVRECELGIVPIYQGPNGWELSEISLPRGFRELSPEAYSQACCKALEFLKNQPQHRWRNFVVAHSKEGYFSGSLMKLKGEEQILFKYDKKSGLELLVDELL